MQTDSTPHMEAKHEYSRKLQQLIAKNIYAYFFEVFCEHVQKGENEETIFMNFQEEMEQVPLWNNARIGEITERIVKDGEFFNQLVTALIILKTKIMTTFKLKGGASSVQLKVPSNDTFIHHLMSVVSEHLFNNPYVFVVDNSKRINTERYRQCMEVIYESIDETIVHFVPVKNILSEYIGVLSQEGIGEEKQTETSTEEGKPEEPQVEEIRRIDPDSGAVENIVKPLNPPPVAPVVEAPPPEQEQDDQKTDYGEDVQAEEVFNGEDPMPSSVNESSMPPPPELSLPDGAPKRPEEDYPETFSDSDDDEEYEYEPATEKVQESSVLSQPPVREEHHDASM